MTEYKISYTEDISGTLIETAYTAKFKNEQELDEAISEIYEFTNAEYVSYEEIK